MAEGEVKVVKGVFSNPRKKEKVGVVADIKGKTFIFKRKVMYAILRTNFSRAIDFEIRDQKRNGTPLEDFFVGAFKKHIPKPMQFFVKNEKVFAAAGINHPLVEPNEVYKILNKALRKQNLPLLEEKSVLQGRVLLLYKTPIARMGLRIDGGNIYTKNAIKVSAYVEVLTCLNPLSFLQLNKSLLTSAEPAKIRILRFRQLDMIPQRMNEAIKLMQPELKKIEVKMNEAQKQPIDSVAAKKIICVFGVSYGIGAQVLKSVLERFEEGEKHTIWGVSMALSWIAEKSDADAFRENTTVARQNLSILAGAILLIDNLNKTVGLCNSKLKREPAMATCLARINGEIPMYQRKTKGRLRE